MSFNQTKSFPRRENAGHPASRRPLSLPTARPKVFVPPIVVEPIEETVLPSRLTAKDKHHKRGYSEVAEEQRHDRLSFKRYLQDTKHSSEEDDEMLDGEFHASAFKSALDARVEDGTIPDEDADAILSYLGSKSVLTKDDVEGAIEYADLNDGHLAQVILQLIPHIE